MKTSVTQKNGFSLIEVTLAILVVGLGLIALMALFPSGLDANKQAINDTRMALFAEDILNGFVAIAEDKSWNDINSIQVPAVAIDMWNNPSSLSVIPSSSVQTNVYLYSNPEIAAYAVRYRLEVGDLAGNSAIKYIRLTLWNGEYGPTNKSHSFYTEIYNK